MTSISCKNQIFENRVLCNVRINCVKLREDCYGLFKFHLFLFCKFSGKGKTIQKMDGATGL